MILLGLRFAVAGGRDAIGRLALIAVGVAVGSALLLSTLATINAVEAQNGRFAWLLTGNDGGMAAGTPGAAGDTDPLWWMARADYFDGERIGRVDVAATGPDSPVPPGIDGLPEPGEMYVSPALSQLLAATPAEQLAERFKASIIGTIDDAALPGPDSLIAVVGQPVAELSQRGHAMQVDAIGTVPPHQCTRQCAFGVGIDGNGMMVILTVVAAALLLPVLIFIGSATRLAAARREQRFAALRLLGATPRQVAVIATAEAAVAAVAGVAAAFGLFAAARPLLARISFTEERFFTGDLSLGIADVALVAIGIPAVAAIAARWALRRVNVSPLGVTRRVTPAPPRPWRLLPLAAGIAWLVFLAFGIDVRERTDSATQAYAYLLGISTVIVGLVVAGPWLTKFGSRLVAHRATRPAALIAGRRLADDPRAGFRAMSGLVVALFVGTCTVGIITTIVAYSGNATGAAAPAQGTLVSRTGWMAADGEQPAISPATLEQLRGIDGVLGIAVVRAEPGSSARGAERPRFVVSCEELAAVPAFGNCRVGTSTVEIEPRYGGVLDGTTPMADTTWTDAGVLLDQLARWPVATVAVATNGERTTVEAARTVLELADPATWAPQTLSEELAERSRTLDNYRQLANVVLLASLPIAGGSFAVNITGGLADRRRPFSQLRLSGTPLRVLRRVVLFESAVPLAFGAAAAIGAGLLAAFLFLHAQLDYTLQPLGGAYYAVTAAGLVAALAVIASTLPLLRRVTGPDAARND